MFTSISAPIRALIIDEPHPVAAEIFKEAGFQVTHIKKVTSAELAAHIVGYDALLVRTADVKDKTIFENAERLRVIGRAGTGYDNINRELATQHGVVVMNAPEGSIFSVAELTMAHMLNLARKIAGANANIHSGTWSRSIHENDFTLRDKTLGIIGCGRIGSQVARYAKDFGMNVIVYDPYVPNGKVEDLGGTRVAFLRDLLRASDIVTLHADLNEETRYIINEKTIELCKPGVHVINCARGPMVDAADLAKAIKEGRVAGAAFDVIEDEPLQGDLEKWKSNPLLGLDNVIFTPHVGGTTKESLESVARQVAQQMVAYLREGTVINAVNEPFKSAGNNACLSSLDSATHEPVRQSATSGVRASYGSRLGASARSSLPSRRKVFLIRRNAGRHQMSPAS